MKFIAHVLFMIGAPAFAGPCLSYHADVTLRGVLSRQTFAEAPNYESIAKGDAAASYFFISPKRAFCVSEGSDSENEPAVPKVRTVQLVFPGPEAEADYRLLRPTLGNEVECRGSLYPQITGHHHSRVLLSDAKCRAI